jgi:sugar/nucleoside kinase (ribokinase family)
MEKRGEINMVVQILGDLIADISMRLPKFPVQAKDIHRLSYMEVGPGGACNVAIMAARFGVNVAGLGEVGDDGFGLVVREGLKREGVDVGNLRVTAGARTPVAGVVVDNAGEPGYLGYAGSLHIRTWPAEWNSPVQNAQALFADGWAEYKETPELILHAFGIARESNVITFFDPGPGNPDVDNAWMKDALSMTDVVMVNRGEARRLIGDYEDTELVDSLRRLGATRVLLKRGAEGLMLAHENDQAEAPGLKVEIRDATGAGDSVAGAMLYGVLNKMSVERLAVLANATGAAKVTKLGTGHNMPTLQEIATILDANSYHASDYLPAIS